MSDQKFIVKNIKLPVELNDRLERFKKAYQSKILGDIGYSVSHTDVIRFLMITALDKLEKEFGVE